MTEYFDPYYEDDYYEDDLYDDAEDIRQEVAELRDWFQSTFAVESDDRPPPEVVSEAIRVFEAETGLRLDDEHFNELGHAVAEMAEDTGQLDPAGAFHSLYAEDVEYNRQFLNGVERVERSLGRELTGTETSRVWNSIPELADSPDVEQAWWDLHGDTDPAKMDRVKHTAEVIEDAKAEEAIAETQGGPELEPFTPSAKADTHEAVTERRNALAAALEDGQDS